MRRAVVAIVVFCSVAARVRGTELEVPFQLSPLRGMILIEVRVDNRPRTFLIDTGATFTVVDRSLFSVSDYELKQARFDWGGAGLAFEAVIRTAAVQIGAHRWSERQLLVTDIASLAETYGRKIDGLLGQDALSEFASVTIDYARRVLTLTSK
jgi:predicted aspartyl protease